MKSNNRIGRRDFLRYTAGGSALALAGSWSRGSDAQAANALTIGVLRAPAAAIVDLSQHHGWFKEAGVELKTELFASAAGPKIVQALGGGAVDVSFVNTTAALLGMAGGAIPLRFISICTDPSKLFALLSNPSIDTVPKLAGKRVACTAGTGLQYYLARILSKFNMTLKDIEFVNLPAAEGQAAFVAGRVDAIVPSVNGRFYIMNNKKDTRELFGYADFMKPPGSTMPFQNYDFFVTTEQVLQAKRKTLQSFLAAYHNKGVPYLMNPATRPDAIKTITEYVNAEQKNPTDAAIMKRIMDDSGFYDAKQAKQIMTSPELKANMEFQVKFFMEQGAMKSAPDLSQAIVTDML
jgi:ABC-type nitrate/sulfonate/bicarbonate transport system substrate-binding protein